MLFAGQNIDKSPFGVNVGMALGDASKVTARGPGLEPVGNVANKATYFDIYTAGGRGGTRAGACWWHPAVVGPLWRWVAPGPCPRGGVAVVALGGPVAISSWCHVVMWWHRGHVHDHVS